jgi:hypothetical protein
MYEEDTNVLLISSRPSRDTGRGHSREASKEHVYYLSDSDRGSKADHGDGFEETTVFSDSLYGESLPSMRAQLAATQMQNRGRKGGGGMELDTEKESLLSSNEEEGSVMETSIGKDKANGHYNSLGGKIVTSKKRARKETMWN